jgi:hypothetical protein
MRAAFIAGAASLAAGCGSDSTSGKTSAADPKPPTRASARFSERTVYPLGGEDVTSITRGAFDWDARRGFAIQRGLAPREHLIQIHDTCYRRRGNGPWKRSRATDVDGLCSASDFSNPATIADVMRVVAGGWHQVGRASVRDVPTTHYRGDLNVGAVKGAIDMWIDEEGVVHRLRQRGPEPDGFVTVREYFDFGVDVRVRRPTTEGSR